MFKIPATTRSLREIEDISSRLLSGKPTNLAVGLEDLKRRRGALHDAAFTQLLVTWARRFPESAFVIDALADSYSPEALEDGVSYSPAIAAARLAGSIRWGDKEITRHTALTGVDLSFYFPQECRIRIERGCSKPSMTIRKETWQKSRIIY